MKQFILLAALLALAIGLTACAPQTPAPTATPAATITPGASPVATQEAAEAPKAEYRQLTAEQAKARMDSGDEVIILDVRTPEECKQICLADCPSIKYIPLGELRSQLEELNKEDEIIAFCKISLRGYEAEGILEGAGFKDVKVMEGGIVAWPFRCEKGK